MDEMTNETPRPANPRRRKRTKMQIFKDTYLPLVIAGAALLCIAVFIIGAISRGVQRSQAEREASVKASESLAAQQEQQAAEANSLLNRAAAQAAGFDYQGAIATIDSFSGNIADYPDLEARRADYASKQASMIPWTNPSDVVNLSFQMLVADSARAYADDTYGDAYNRNFVTTTEFQKILQQLYANGYILVDLEDIITTEPDANGQTTYVAKTLYLPEGKKPLMITQANVNYDQYMIDGDGDGVADKDGAGFASRLLVDANGSVTAEMVDASGNTIQGAYDLVPILDAFIAEHPDFSYGGAKAILALSGHEGLFGYRTTGAVKSADETKYNEAVQGATAVANALRASGYTLAYYTYYNETLSGIQLAAVQTDLKLYQNEIVPILGNLNILVCPKNSDLETYSGDIFNALMEGGFRYYLGYYDQAIANVQLPGSYVRQGRISVTGYNMSKNADLFKDIFDPATVLDSNRPDFSE